MATDGQKKLWECFKNLIEVSNNYANNISLIHNGKKYVENSDDFLLNVNNDLIDPFYALLINDISAGYKPLVESFDRESNYKLNIKFLIKHTTFTHQLNQVKPFDKITHVDLLNLSQYIQHIKQQIVKRTSEEKTELEVKLEWVEKLTTEMLEEKFIVENEYLLEKQRQLQQAIKTTEIKIKSNNLEIEKTKRKLKFICETEKQIVESLKTKYLKGEDRFQPHKDDSPPVLALFLEDQKHPVNSLFGQCQLVAQKKITNRKAYRKGSYQANTLSYKLKCAVKSIKPESEIVWILEDQDVSKPPKLETNHDTLENNLSKLENDVLLYKEAIIKLERELEEVYLEIVEKRNKYHRSISLNNNNQVEKTGIAVDHIDGNIDKIYRALGGTDKCYKNDSILKKAKELNEKYKNFDTKPYEKLQLITEIHDYRLYQKCYGFAILIILYIALVGPYKWKHHQINHKDSDNEEINNCTEKKLEIFNDHLKSRPRSTSAEIHKELVSTECAG